MRRNAATPGRCCETRSGLNRAILLSKILLGASKHFPGEILTMARQCLGSTVPDTGGLEGGRDLVRGDWRRRSKIASRWASALGVLLHARQTNLHGGENAGWLAPIELEPKRKKVRGKSPSHRASNRGCVLMLLPVAPMRENVLKLFPRLRRHL